MIRLLICFTFVASMLGAQTPVAAQVELVGLHGERQILHASELGALPHREVTARAHQISGTFSGVPLADLLKLVQAPVRDSSRGRALTTYVMVEAGDGFRALFGLAELDSGFTDRVVLLADRRNGTVLDARSGPLQVIVA